MAEIVGLVTGVLGPVIEVGKCIVEPIKRQFNHLCCFDNNIQSLRDEARKLDNARVGLQGQVDAAKRNTDVIVPQVEVWLENVNAIQVDMSLVESEIPYVASGCLSFKSRFSLSRKAKKMAEVMKELHDNVKFGRISHLALPAAMGSIPLGQTYEIPSRKHMEEEIMTTLREKKVNIMGICGMGGVGKTTMAKKIMKRVREEHMFDETVMVIVSQQPDMLKIQQQVADPLGLKFEVESLLARAHKLRARLMHTNRTLIILDDLWEILDLEELGVPREIGSEGCTVLLTSRNRGVFNGMSVQKVFGMQTLSEREACFLFKEKVGPCVDDPDLVSIAQEIIKECKGLPVALVTVGVALKNQTGKYIWQDALQQLRSSNPTNIPNVLAEVYNPIKLSYELLGNRQLQFIILLCCLFPEDHNISLYYLTCYCWGLHIFEGVRSLEEARNRMLTLVEILKSGSLLLDGGSIYRVKMHDIVRDVAIFIASNEGLIDLNLDLITRPRHQSYNNCTLISSFLMGERPELPIGLVYPNLRLILIDNLENEENEISFEGMRELNVLSISGSRCRSLPYTTKLLKNLQTLILSSIKHLETISIVGELVSLEILICRGCYSIREVPKEIERISRLKLLDFCLNSRELTIAPGVISSLVRLEELILISSFNNWEAEDKGKESNNARLKELESLSKLRRLEIEVEDSTLAAEPICLSSTLVQFDVVIGGHYRPDGMTRYTRRMVLVLARDITLADWIHKLLGRCEAMYLGGEGSSNLVASELGDLKWLYWGKANMTTLMDGSSGTTTVFPLLRVLHLEKLPNLEAIYNGPTSPEIPSSNSFKNLEELRLEELPSMKYLWKRPFRYNDSSLFNNLSSVVIRGCHSLPNLSSLALASDRLLQLERLEIKLCYMMEQVVFWNEEQHERVNKHSNIRRRVTFTKLKSFTLESLPKLVDFWNGDQIIEFPLLTEMRIGKCPYLKSLVSTPSSWRNNNHDDGDHDSLHFFCKSKVAFDNLKELHIDEVNNTLTLWCGQTPIDFFTRLKKLAVEDCGNIRSLFSPLIAQNLVTLKELIIMSCEKMVKVIEHENEDRKDVTEGEMTILLINLERLILDKLPKLTSFCDWKCGLELPSLTQLWISDCPEMKRFSMKSATTPKLGAMYLNDHWDVTTRDLNDKLLRPQSSAYVDPTCHRLILPGQIEFIDYVSDIIYEF